MTEPGGRNATGRGGPAGRTAAGPGGLAGRPHFTGRAAILAVVICAIALSLAYPVREYIAQRRQIDQLLDQRSRIGVQLSNLEQERRQLNDPVYVERVARDRLHMCLPSQMCYVIISPPRRPAVGSRAARNSVPWYARMWSSVQQANYPRAAGHHEHRTGRRLPG